MRKSGIIGIAILACAQAATAMAASGAELEGISILMIMFLGFGALIISFQGILVGALLFSMAKALLAKPVKQEAAMDSGQSNGPS